MTITKNKGCRNFLFLFLTVVCFFAGRPAAHAQTYPPAPANPGTFNPNYPPVPFIVTPFPVQNLFFGAFFQGMMGGTVIVYPDGSRSSTGDIFLTSLGFPFSPAIFEVEAQIGTRISILNGPDAVLTGSNGGSMTMHIGASDIGTPFITTVAPPSKTQIRIGGTLTVANPLSNPEGTYSGMFQVTFVQE